MTEANNKKREKKRETERKCLCQGETIKKENKKIKS